MPTPNRAARDVATAIQNSADSGQMTVVDARVEGVDAELARLCDSKREPAGESFVVYEGRDDDGRAWRVRLPHLPQPATEHAFSRQATKADLVEIALALGVQGASDRRTVPELRRAIRQQLALRPAEQRVVDAVLAWVLPRDTSDDRVYAGDPRRRERPAARAPPQGSGALIETHTESERDPNECTAGLSGADQLRDKPREPERRPSGDPRPAAAAARRARERRRAADRGAGRRGRAGAADVAGRAVTARPVTEYVVIGEDTLPVDTVELIDAAARALAQAGVASAPVYVSPHPLEWIRQNGDPDAVETSLLVHAAASRPSPLDEFVEALASTTEGLPWRRGAPRAAVVTALARRGLRLVEDGDADDPRLKRFTAHAIKGFKRSPDPGSVTAAKPIRYDAHIKARRSLVARIAREGVPEALAAEALAAYKWPPGWGQKMQTAIDGYAVAAVFKQVPAWIVRCIVHAARKLRAQVRA